MRQRAVMQGKGIEGLVDARQQIHGQICLLGTADARRQCGFGGFLRDRQIESCYAAAYSAEENTDRDCQTSQ